MKRKYFYGLIFTVCISMQCGCSNVVIQGNNGTASFSEENEEQVAQTAVRVDPNLSVSVTNENNTVDSKKNKEDSNDERIDSLLKQNKMYEQEISNYKEMMKQVPDIQYKDMSLFIDGIETIINNQKSMVTIDGQTYFSEDVLNGMLDENERLTVEEDGIFIGKVIADKKSLVSQYVVNSSCVINENTVTDSYGNILSNVIKFDSYWGNANIIYNVNEKYNKLKFVISVSNYADINNSGIFKVEADGTIVYTSDSITKITKSFEVDIPINNCSLLEITYEGDNHFDCYISDAILYNE